MKSLLTSTAICSSLISTVCLADYTGDGTDYSLALIAQQTWSEDASNDFVSTPNSFACIISKSRPDILPNSSREVLIDEVDCGLEEADATAGGVTYAKARLVSQRASNSTPQEVTAWFDTKSGDRYISDTILRKSAVDLEPFGSWYFSFIYVGDPQETADYPYTAATTPEYGFVDINETDEGDVEVLVAQTYSQEEGNQRNEGSVEAKVVYIGGSTENTKFYGFSENIGYVNNVNMFGDSTEIAGVTNATNYFRASILEDVGTVVDGSQACFSRDTKFETNHKIKIFDPDTGDEVALNGGFGFTTQSGQMGYVGHWGVWIDGGETLFSPSNSEIDITDDDGVAYTLKWSPGKLKQRTLVEEMLATGDEFTMWYESEGQDVTATWNGSGFVLTDTDDNEIDTLTETNWARWLWSDLKRESVIWDGGSSVKIVVEDDVTFSSAMIDETYTKFYSRWEYSNHTDAENLPYSWSDFSENGGNIYWDRDQSGSRKTYFYTGAAPGDDLEPHTLYLDNGDGSLTSADAQVRYDFGINDAQDVVTRYGGSPVEIEGLSGAWPSAFIDLILSSQADSGIDDSCSISGRLDGCDQYTWRFGAMPWDQGKSTFNQDGEPSDLDQPIKFQVTYDSSLDRNSGIELDIATNSTWNPLKDCSSEGSGDEAYELCEGITPSDFDGSKFMLEFDGNHLHGSPGMEVCHDLSCSGNSYWMNLVNYDDGTLLEDVDGNEYVLLATEVGSTFVPTDMSNCSDLSFASLAEIGLSADDLPEVDRSSSEYPLPSSAWDDAPAAEDLVCTVVHGDASDCTSE